MASIRIHSRSLDRINYTVRFVHPVPHAVTRPECAVFPGRRRCRWPHGDLCPPSLPSPCDHGCNPLLLSVGVGVSPFSVENSTMLKGSRVCSALDCVVTDQTRGLNTGGTSRLTSKGDGYRTVPRMFLPPFILGTTLIMGHQYLWYTCHCGPHPLKALRFAASRLVVRGGSESLCQCSS